MYSRVSKYVWVPFLGCTFILKRPKAYSGYILHTSPQHSVKINFEFWPSTILQSEVKSQVLPSEKKECHACSFGISKGLTLKPGVDVREWEATSLKVFDRPIHRKSCGYRSCET